MSCNTLLTDSRVSISYGSLFKDGYETTVIYTHSGGKVMRNLSLLILILTASVLAGGCAIGVAAGAGAVAADEYDEAKECGDDFDPLEEVRGQEDGCN